MSSTNKIFNSYIGSILLDFPINPSYCQIENAAEMEKITQTVLEKRFGPLTKLFSGKVSEACGHYIALLKGDKSRLTVTLKTYPSRSHATCTIEYDAKDFPITQNLQGLLSLDAIGQLESEIGAELKGTRKKTREIPVIKRALDFDTYFTTSDCRLLEYDIEEMIFDQHSKFQHVQIGRSVNFGNILVLDGLVNLAESDLIYTESIMCRGQEGVSYVGKDVLILGGGDGALLYELRKEKANSITMIEIDDVVMQACKVHMRSVCGDTLDNYKHENYEIILGDCIQFMEKCVDEGRKFDFVFGDLTDIPISPNHQTHIWDFIKKTLQLSFKVLKENGTYYTHANGITDSGNLEMYANTIKESLGFPVDLQSSTAFIPSFKEKWVFFQVKKSN